MTDYNNHYAHSLAIAKNGDFIIGGVRFVGPYVMRTDTLGNIKWATWYYDSILDKNLLQGKGVINSLRETSRGTIICAAGDDYPDNNGLTLNSYAALLEFDSLGRNPYLPSRPCYIAGQFNKEPGYKLAGFYVDETKGGNFVLSGMESVYYTDSIGNPDWKQTYTFMMEGVGTVSNKVCRAKVLRDNRLMVAGQAYERNSWQLYNALFYDAWWSPVDYGGGTNKAWDTAGMQQASDILYDFTQLDNGNLAFTGTRGGGNGKAKVWVFVTDTAGGKVLFEKELFAQDSSAYPTLCPLSIAASPDSGFTVSGYAQKGLNKDALVMHFVPRPKTAVISRGNSSMKSFNGFNVHVAGAKLIVINNSAIKNNCEAMLFNLTGKQIAARTGEKEMVFDISHLSYGTYVVREGSQTVKFVIEH